jgi:hypothetical protein
MDGAIEPERMEWTMKVLSRVVMWGLLFCFPVGANALEPEKPSDKSIEIGVGLICNSEEQVQRYLSLHVKDEEPETAIQTVNTEAKDPNACSMAAIAFVRGKEGATVPAPGGQMKITQITIVAAQTPFGWEPVSDLVQYTAIFETLDEA